MAGGWIGGADEVQVGLVYKEDRRDADIRQTTEMLFGPKPKSKQPVMGIELTQVRDGQGVVDWGFDEVRVLGACQVGSMFWGSWRGC